MPSTTGITKYSRPSISSHVQTWIKTMTVAGLAPSTVAMRYRYVRGVFNAAVGDKLIANDPSDGIKLPRTRRAEVAMEIPTPEQVGKIMAAAEEWFVPLIGLCAFAGLRLGESAATKVTDINWLKRTLTVSRQVQRAGGGRVRISAPKCGAEREIYLPDALLTMLAHHIETTGIHPDGWLFIGSADGPPYQNQVGNRWRRTLKSAGLSGIRLHDLRHFYASGLIAEGCDVVTVQRALGHSSATITLNTYSHLWPTAEDRTRKAAGAMMNAALADSAAPADSSRTF
jgi:integrase